MALTWATLKGQIARKLNDPTYKSYSEELLMDAANDALVAFAAAHTGLASDFEITGDGSTYQFDLPDNIVDEEGAKVYAVHWQKNTWLQEIEYWPGSVWPNQTITTTSRPLGYTLWPAGKITFSRIPTSGQVTTVHYVAYYDEIVGDDSAIQVPRWAREAIKLYAAAASLEPASAKAGKLGQYKSRREAGEPEDNPLLRLAEHFMKRYYNILAAHQPPQYDKLMEPG